MDRTLFGYKTIGDITIERKGDITIAKYNQIPIVTFGKEFIMLNIGGKKTTQIKNRMNKVSKMFDLEFFVYQECGEWYVQWTPGGLNQTLVGDIRWYDRIKDLK
jgi:hypothetical protein